MKSIFKEFSTDLIVVLIFILHLIRDNLSPLFAILYAIYFVILLVKIYAYFKTQKE